ncbi:MAG: 50S ribosomal protein L11 methyltransferase [Desulfovibrio sp.]|uniref:50S ribosomal protein L11 methyltransferase n=1 Tax=Desulfovibrio sp. TaxID=885 RepID=UPI001A650854|nr:50S ribosomal protein L11 methyltransferase [Desulfovibrio sp.]MBD5418127.1 50S ribosomal protein L11 methyltransferase [Desulfovibrio sp.]
MPETDTPALFRLEIVAEDEDFDRVSGLLALDAAFGWEEESLAGGETRFTVHCESEEYLRRLLDQVLLMAPQAGTNLARVEKQDWLAAWRQFFTPVLCGSRFVVLPPWLAGTGDFPGRIPILIEPKSAFGTGHHATTALCLAVLSELLDAGRVEAGQTFLDLGTGSGILGIGCAKSGLGGVGLDIDPLAVDNARENRAFNDIAPAVFEIDAGSVDAVAGRQFDLVLANILARPLREMAPAIAAARATGGCLVLSGLLESQADAVEAAYREQGLPQARRSLDGEWCALVWA